MICFDYVAVVYISNPLVNKATASTKIIKNEELPVVNLSAEEEEPKNEKQPRLLYTKTVGFPLSPSCVTGLI